MLGVCEETLDRNKELRDSGNKKCITAEAHKLWSFLTKKPALSVKIFFVPLEDLVSLW